MRGRISSNVTAVLHINGKHVLAFMRDPSIMSGVMFFHLFVVIQSSHKFLIRERSDDSEAFKGFQIEN